MASPSASRINARAAKDKKFLQRALANPGLRSKLDPKYLSTGQRAQRKLNTRLRAPIVPGSSTTEGQLATEANAATTVRYGPQERTLQEDIGTARTRERDLPGFYDQYLAQLAQHASNVQAFQAGAQQALAGTAAGITGLAGAEGGQLQQQANQAAAAQGVSPAGNLAQMASGAAATRQALLGSFQAQQAMTGAAQSGAASAQAHQVAPTQRLAARAQAAQTTQKQRDRLTDLKAQEGAYNTQYRGERRADERKNVIAQQTLAGNLANTAADNRQAQATAAETGRHHRAEESAARSRVRAQRAAAVDRANAADNKRDRTGPFAGMTAAAINALTPQQAQAKVDAYDKKHGTGPGGRGGKGPDWQTPEQSGAAMTQLTSLKSMAQKAREGRKFVVGQGQSDTSDPSARLDRRRAGQKILGFAPVAGKLKHPILVTAALDAVYAGHLSPPTVKALIAAGLKPSEVARTLGVPTAGQMPRGSRRSGRPRREPNLAATIPVVGSAVR